MFSRVLLNNRLRISGVILSLSLQTTLARAETAADAKTGDDASTMGTVSVYGKRTGYVAEEADSATKTDTPLIETPQAISVVTRDQMDDRGVSNLTDALHYAAGVRTDEASGAGVTQDNFFIRGFNEAGIGSFLDGLRQVYEPVDGAANTYALDRVEILRGPSSVLYGQNDPGGLVNMVSKHPGGDPVHQLDLTYGEYKRYQIAADYSDRIDGSDQWFFRGVGLFRKSDTEINFVHDDDLYLAPSLMWKPSDSTRITVLAGYERNKSAFFYGLPPWGSLLPNPNGQLPWSFFSGDPGFSHKQTQRSWAGYELQHRFNEVWSFSQNARYSHIKIDDRRLGPQGDFSLDFDDPRFGTALESDNRTFDRQAQGYFWRIDIAQIDNHLIAKFNSDGLQQTVLFGVDYAHVKDDNDLFSGAAPSLDLYAPLYNQPIGDLSQDNGLKTRLSQTGLYAQDQLKLYGKWIGVASIRQDFSKLDQSNTALYLDPPDTLASSRKDNKFTYRVGAVYVAEHGVAPYVSYSTSFLPNTQTDFNNNTFSPTTGKQIEAGVKYQPVGIDGLATLSVFRINKQNVLVDDPENPGFLLQIGEVRSQGIELEGQIGLYDHLDLLGSYTYTDTTVLKATDGSEGKELTNVPKHMASLWTAYRFGSKGAPGLRVGAGVRYVGDTFGDSLNSIPISNYTLVDAGADYQIAHLQFSLSAKNLADRHYLFSYSGGNFAFFGTGRAWVANVRYIF